MTSMYKISSCATSLIPPSFLRAPKDGCASTHHVRSRRNLRSPVEREADPSLRQQLLIPHHAALVRRCRSYLEFRRQIGSRGSGQERRPHGRDQRKKVELPPVHSGRYKGLWSLSLQGWRHLLFPSTLYLAPPWLLICACVSSLSLSCYHLTSLQSMAIVISRTPSHQRSPNA